MGNYHDMQLGNQREPDYVGKNASVWRVNLRPWEEREVKDNGSLFGVWFVLAPQYNSLLDYYVVSLNHLRPIEGKPEAWKATQDREYEVTVFALDPTQPLPDLDKLERFTQGPHVFLLTDDTEFMMQLPTITGGDAAVSIGIDAAMKDIAEGSVIGVHDLRVQWAQAIIARTIVVPPPQVN
jgi:hypothetical protein